MATDQQRAKRDFPDEDLFAIRRLCGGRRKYNQQRQAEADARRARVAELLRTHDLCKRGSRVAIARALGVHPGTITRYLTVLFVQVQADREANGKPQ